MNDPYSAAQDLLREDHLERLVDRKDRMDGVTWWKQDLCARRRVLPPKVVVHSPWEGARGCKAERVMPEIRVWDEEGDLRMGVRNLKGAGKRLRVWVAREGGDGCGGVEREVEGGGEVEIVLKGAKGKEEKVVGLDLKFSYVGKGGRDSGGEWRVRVFSSWDRRRG